MSIKMQGATNIRTMLRFFKDNKTLLNGQSVFATIVEGVHQ